MPAQAEVGAKRRAPNGYWYVKQENGKWELISRVIAQEKLGRPLRSDEFVVILNGNKDDLTPENVEVRKRGTTSLRKRLAVVEDRIRELSAERDELVRRLKIQDELAQQVL